MAADPPPPEPPEQDMDEAEEERGPLRRCIVTRERLPKEAMIRFVLAPDRTLVPDLEGRLPGRGMWLSARRDVLERAGLRGAFARAARGPVQAPPDLHVRIEAGLKRRIRDLLGFARRAGQAVCGFQKAQEWLKEGRAALLVQAADGSPAERRRLVGGRREIAVVAPLDAAELGAIFGRDHVVHVALAPGRLAQAVEIEAGRLAGIAADDGMRQEWDASPTGAKDEGEAERLAGGTDGT